MKASQKYGNLSIGDTSPVSEEEEELLRDQYDEVYVKGSAGASSQPALHLIDEEEDRPLCNGINQRKYRKPFSVYPPGYFDVCQTCAGHWRNQNE